MLRLAICVSLVVCLTAAPASVNKAKQSIKSAVKKRSMETIQYQPNNNKPVSTIKKSMGTDGVAPPDVSQMSADKLDKKAVMKSKTAAIPAKKEVSASSNPPKTDDEIKQLTQMVLNSEYSKENQEPDTPPQSGWRLSSRLPQELPDRDSLMKQDQEKKNVGAMSFHDYFYPLFSNSRRRRRTQPVYTAEGMTPDIASETQHRTKRDIRLTPQDMDLLMNYLNKNGDRYGASGRYIDVPGDAFDYGRRKRGDEFMSDEDSSMERDKLQDEMDLIRYLDGVDDLKPAGRGYSDEFPVDSLESRFEDTSSSYPSSEEVDFDADNAQAIVYQGEPGIFIPTKTKSAEYKAPEKRQLMSFVSGSKRNSFYPYAYEPSVSSKWGALMAGEKRDVSMGDYERLYKLANALRGQQAALSADRRGIYDDY